MSVAPAKAVFSEKTMNEIFIHIAKEMNCEQSIVFTSRSLPSKFVYGNYERYIERVTFLRKRLCNGTVTPLLRSEIGKIKSDIACIEFGSLIVVIL